MAEITPKETSTYVRKLQGIITDMDALAQDGFDRIEAIANLALCAMETEKAYRLPELLEAAFKTISLTAMDVQNGITRNAETVGCDWNDEGSRSRTEAYYKAMREDRRGHQGEK